MRKPVVIHVIIFSPDVLLIKVISRYAALICVSVLYICMYVYIYVCRRCGALIVSIIAQILIFSAKQNFRRRRFVCCCQVISSIVVFIVFVSISILQLRGGISCDCCNDNVCTFNKRFVVIVGVVIVVLCSRN